MVGSCRWNAKSWIHLRFQLTVLLFLFAGKWWMKLMNTSEDWVNIDFYFIILLFYRNTLNPPLTASIPMLLLLLKKITHWDFLLIILLHLKRCEDEQKYTSFRQIYSKHSEASATTRNCYLSSHFSQIWTIFLLQS